MFVLVNKYGQSMKMIDSEAKPGKQNKLSYPV